MHKINKISAFLLLFVFKILLFNIFASDSISPTGFASVSGYGYSTTTGGQGGDTVTVTTAQELADLLYQRYRDEKAGPQNPLTIYISGTLTHTSSMVDVKDVTNISIVGKGNDAKLYGFGLKLRRARNIIITNLYFEKCDDDAISIEGADDDGVRCNHIWIHHCDFSSDLDHGNDYYDGLIDIKNGAEYITVSWNKFHNHWKGCLMGSSDNESARELDSKMTVTYHHNSFIDVVSRMPRVRFGKAHVYNNYYKSVSHEIYYCVASVMDAQVVVENCYINNINQAFYTLYGDSPDPGYLSEKGNVFVNTPIGSTGGTVYNPADFYSYTLDDTDALDTLIEKYAGVGKLFPGIENDDTTGNPDTNITDTVTSIVYYDGQNTGLKIMKNLINPVNSPVTVYFSINVPQQVNISLIGIDCKIFNIQNKFFNTGINEIKIDNSIFKPGIYILMISSGEDRVCEKLIIQ